MDTNLLAKKIKQHYGFKVGQFAPDVVFGEFEGLLFIAHWPGPKPWPTIDEIEAIVLLPQPNWQEFETSVPTLSFYMTKIMFNPTNFLFAMSKNIDEQNATRLKELMSFAKGPAVFNLTDAEVVEFNTLLTNCNMGFTI